MGYWKWLYEVLKVIKDSIISKSMLLIFIFSLVITSISYFFIFVINNILFFIIAWFVGLFFSASYIIYFMEKN